MRKYAKRVRGIRKSISRGLHNTDPIIGKIEQLLEEIEQHDGLDIAMEGLDKSDVASISIGISFRSHRMTDEELQTEITEATVQAEKAGEVVDEEMVEEIKREFELAGRRITLGHQHIGDVTVNRADAQRILNILKEALPPKPDRMGGLKRIIEGLER